MIGKKYFDVKITLIKKIDIPDIHEQYAVEGVPHVCARYKEGSEYISTNCNKPDAFCSWAWAELHQRVVCLAVGGNYPNIKQKGTEIFCCTDGLHPVIYKLERIE